eukprot:COSAG01_NODE_10945_length_2039_cov_26.816169_2_plen_126_part_01
MRYPPLLLPQQPPHIIMIIMIKQQQQQPPPQPLPQQPTETTDAPQQSLPSPSAASVGVTVAQAASRLKRRRDSVHGPTAAESERLHHMLRRTGHELGQDKRGQAATEADVDALPATAAATAAASYH